MKVLTINKGITIKKLELEASSILLRGAGMDKSVLSNGDGGYDLMPDGRKRGTFRSYTAFISGQDVTVKDLTIENTAGDGRVHGQAVALYADAERFTCKRVHLKGHQDTLFLSPLPVKEREPDGFKGPRQKAPRIPTIQYYEDCLIEGDIDFIFGGADAIFRNCEIRSLFRPPLESDDNRQIRYTHDGVPIQGFVCAPCTPEGGRGFEFINCLFTTDCCPDGSVYLARPWRPYGKAVFKSCSFGAHIAPERFAGWANPLQVESTADFLIL
ncbi:MAG: pectinesterase family protein [Butyrivibrio sp.]|jgi:pectinesterase|nr:pectinesterase family protein [Butyrivibrio sp.]